MENVLIEYLNKKEVTASNLIGVLFSRCHFLRTPWQGPASLPKRIGEYVLQQEVRNPNDHSEFRVALYESHSGERAFLKLWSDSAKTPGYYALKNEISIYALLGSVPPEAYTVKGTSFRKVLVPRLIQWYEKAGELGLFISEVRGQTLEKLPLAQQDAAFRAAVIFLSGAHDKLSRNPQYNKNIPMLSIKYIIYIFPALLLLAIVRNPSLFMRASKALWRFIKNLRKAFTYKTQTLVHRDLTNTNLLVEQESLSIFDFESAVQAPPALESAQFLVSICNSGELLREFSSKPEFAILKTKGATRAAQIIVSLYVAVLHLATRQQFDRTAYVSYLDIILNS